LCAVLKNMFILWRQLISKNLNYSHQLKYPRLFNVLKYYNKNTYKFSVREHLYTTVNYRTYYRIK